MLHVIDAATGKDLGESIDRAQSAQPAWLPDGSGFFYTRLQKLAPGAGPLDRYLLAKTYLHRLGTDPEADPPLLGKGLVPNIELSDSDMPFIWAQIGSRWALAVISRGSRPEASHYAAPIEEAMKPVPTSEPLAAVVRRNGYISRHAAADASPSQAKRDPSRAAARLRPHLRLRPGLLLLPASRPFDRRSSALLLLHLRAKVRRVGAGVDAGRPGSNVAPRPD